jgi:hypothetical protein
VSHVDQWDRCSLGGVELPGLVEVMELRKKEIRDEWKRHAACFSFILPAGCTVEVITPSGEHLARWEDEGGAL